MRTLDKATLDNAAQRYAAHFLLPSRQSTKPSKLWLAGRKMVEQDLFNLTFKDEFDFIVEQMKAMMAGPKLAEFEKLLKGFKPREDKVLQALLKERLAIDPNGKHIDGEIGKTEIGRNRLVGNHPMLARHPIVRPVDPAHPEGEWKIIGYKERMRTANEWWPVYAGENEERIAGRVKKNIGDTGPGADPLPPGAMSMPIGANVTNISAESCIAGIDAIADRLDEGDAAAEIRGRTGAQPADPDAAETGTLLFTLPMSDPAFNAGVDDTDGSCSAAAAAITDDASADATGTLGYCRMAAVGIGADDHIDGNSTTDGTGATDWNTLSIVSGSTVSMTSASIGQSQGSTAT